MVKNFKLFALLIPLLMLFGCSAMIEPRSDIQRSVDYLRQDVEKLTKQQEELTRKVNELTSKSSQQETVASPAIIPSEKLAIDDSSNLQKESSTLYDKGMELMKQGKFDEARELFAKFINEYPQSELADNAQYWMGECFYSQKRFEEAKETFEGVSEHFPFGNKVPMHYTKLHFVRV